MKDSFYEQLVPVKRSKTFFYGGMILFLLVLAAVVLVSFLFLGITAVLIGWVVGMLFYFFIYPKFNIEYEYSLVNHNLDIDVVYSKSKRKHLYSLDLQEAEAIAPKDSPALHSYGGARTKDLTSRTGQYPVYSIIVAQNSGRMNLVIEPDAEMLERIRQWSGRKFIAENA